MRLWEPEGAGIAVVREMLTSLQRGEFGKALTAHALKIPRALLDGSRLVLGRSFSIDVISAAAVLKLQFNVAQDVPSSSRIALSSESDAFDLSQVVMDWRVTEREIGSMRRCATHLKAQFEAMRLMGVQWVMGDAVGE